MILGPTEHRVARYLADLTRSGRVTIRTVELATRLGLERSEAYRITRRLRVLGLFGIENDRGGSRGGRRVWRTAIEHDGGELEAVRHRAAWARIVSWARARRASLGARLAHIRSSRPDGRPGRPTLAPPAFNPRVGGASGSFAEAMRRHGLGPLMDEWARPRIAGRG